jgi:hypothetical protein
MSMSINSFDESDKETGSEDNDEDEDNLDENKI